MAEKRCEELQWRLQQQDAALAQRAKLAEEARAATEGLSKVHTLRNALSLRDAYSSPHRQPKSAFLSLQSVHHEGILLCWKCAQIKIAWRAVSDRCRLSRRFSPQVRDSVYSTARHP